MSPVRYQPSSVNAAAVASGVVPVALEEGRAAELDLAVVGEPHLDPLGRPADRPEPVVLERRARARSRSRSRRSPGGR